MLFPKYPLMDQAGDQAAGGGGDAGAAAAGADAGKEAAGAAAGAGAAASAQANGDWPENWVKLASNNDEKVEKMLGRYSSPKALAEAHIALRKRMDSGEFVQKLGKDAKPEEIAKWRKDNGIPEKPDGYELKFDSGLVIGKEDMPIIDSFRKVAHEHNLDPNAVKATIEWYYGAQEQAVEARAAQDEQERQETIDLMSGEWGAAVKDERRGIEQVLSLFPESVRETLKAARLPDGRGVFNNIDVIRGFSALAHELYPEGVTVPGAVGADRAKGVNDRIAEIEGVMKKNRAAYNKDEKMQTEYRTLIEARERMKEKAA